MSIRETVKKVLDNVSGTNSTSKFTFEEKRYENGELHIKKIVKHGEEADKEIAKHLPKFSEFFKDFMK
jgi:hypothetical protein